MIKLSHTLLSRAHLTYNRRLTTTLVNSSNQFCFSDSKQVQTTRPSIIPEVRKIQSEYCNIPDKLLELVDRDLINLPNHPLGILKNKIKNFFLNNNNYKSDLQKKNPVQYTVYDNLSPIVSTKECFDDLLVPPDHVSRKRSDTYYVNKETLLRTHTSSHQKQFISSGNKAFVVFGDVYRRDEIDATHYPCFHQMEGVRIFTEEEIGTKQEDVVISAVMEDLKQTHESLIREIFGDVQMRWIPAYFPFTDPSLELEIYFNDKWVEMLGCGVIHHDLMKNSGRKDNEYGWASGLGLERFAMKLFDIPDIRLFWSQDERFTNQFTAGNITKFKPYSKYPSCFKDVSFWVKGGMQFEENDLYETVRNIAGDLIEKVECVDTYEDKKRGRTSKCYRIFYRSLDRTLVNEEIDTLQFKIRDDIKSKLGLELR